MKRLIFVLLGVLVVLVGSISMYLYLNPAPQKELHHEMFVDRGESYGYAAMYDLCKTL